MLVAWRAFRVRGQKRGRPTTVVSNEAQHNTEVEALFDAIPIFEIVMKRGAAIISYSSQARQRRLFRRR